MGEGIKAGFAVVGAHTAFPHAAKAHGAGGQVDDTVVDAATAKGTAGGDGLHKLLVLGKYIQRQRGVPAVDGFHHRFGGSKGQNGQHRAEDFLAHDLIFPGNVVQNGGSNFQRIRVCFAAADHFAAVNQSRHPVKMLTADDFTVRRIVQRILSVLALNFRLQAGNQLLFHCRMAKNVVRRHTGLAAV